eukprot:TRINITY_DN9447_c0_g1_i1.p1 TRINITY_DN9447_c0_g1~~TRINITY_DN9447_c0_g1_i1.p1  ORF type:complete len:155 (+),score=15.42 TRINITY_DN9447_c0_g1_i1:30-467(+)
MNAPAPYAPLLNEGAKRDWTSGLCGCFSDMSSCCLSCCCPCIQFGSNAEKINGSNSVLMCCLWIVAAHFCCASNLVGGFFRSELREKNGIEGSTCGDFCTHCCCTCCSLAQEARELEARPNNTVFVQSSSYGVPYGGTTQGNGQY